MVLMDKTCFVFIKCDDICSPDAIEQKIFDQFDDRVFFDMLLVFQRKATTLLISCYINTVMRSQFVIKTLTKLMVVRIIAV